MLSSHEMIPLENLLFTPIVVGLLISSKTFGKPSSGAKTLGWEHSKSFLENVFENLGVAYTPLKCFTKRL
jgi:hypothetical protein